MKKFLGLALLGLFVFSSCEEDAEKEADLNSEDSKVLIDGSASDMTEDVISLIESDGVKAATDFAELLDGSEVINGRTSQSGWTKAKLELITQYFVNGPSARTGTDEITSFEDIKGLYEWNPDLNDFNKETSDFFIVKFPTEESEVNNSELKISELEFVTVVDEYDGFIDEYEVPSKINGYLKVDEVTLIILSYSVDWSENGIPEKADIELFVSPFTFLLTFNDAITKSSLLTSIELNEEVITEVDLDVTFEDETKEEVLLVDGSVQYRNLKIQGEIDPREVPVDGNPNEYIDLSLYSADTKVGDIDFVFEEEVGDYVAYVRYSDGSVDNLDDLLEPTLQEIEDIFTEFE